MMTGKPSNYPPGVTGNEHEITGAWCPCCEPPGEWAITEDEVQGLLTEVFNHMAEVGSADEMDLSNEATNITDGIESVATFEEAGLLTANKGVVVTFGDESEFQITIVKRR